MIRLKLQYDVKREATKTLALSSIKIDKNTYLTVEEILTSDYSIKIEQGKLTFYRLGKASEKQVRIKKENSWNFRSFKSSKTSRKTNEIKNNEIKNESNELRNWKKKLIKYETGRYVYDFWQFRTKNLLVTAFLIIKNTKGEADKKV